MSLYNLIETLSLFGESLVKDDKGDLGHFQYRNRRRHKYHGKRAPHHPSPWHHYQIGSAIILGSYLLGPLAFAADMMIDESDNMPTENKIL